MRDDQLLHLIPADAEIPGDHDGLARQGIGKGAVLPGAVETQAGRAQPGDLLLVCGIVQEIIDAAGDHFAHVRHFKQLLLRGRREGVDVPEMPRQALRGGLADIADAQGEEDPLEGDLPGGLQTVEEALGGAVLPALEADELPLGNGIEVRGGAGEAGLVELFDGHFSGQDVHRLAADEMQQAALDLHRAAVLVGTEPLGFRLGLDQGRPTIRAVYREDGLLGICVAVGRVDAGNLGDDLPALLHEHPVPDADVQQGHLVGIVQGGALHQGAAELDRGEVGHRGHGAGAPHLVIDAEQLGAGLFGLEFIGDRPARRLGRVAQGALAGKFVDLDDDAVGGVGEVFPFGVPMVDVGLDLVDVLAEAPLVRDGQAPAGRGVERLAMGGETDRFGGDVVQGADQAAVGDFFGVDELE